MSDTRGSRSDLKGKFGLIAFELALVGVIWYMWYMPHVIAGGLAVIIVVSGVLPERWSTLVTGVLMLAGAALIYVQYPGSRGLAGLIAIIGVLFTIYGAVRARSDRAN